MHENEFPILHHHPHSHIPTLRVDPAIFDVRFRSNCSALTGCIGNCCKGGVWADLAERENIYRHIELIHRYMEDSQEHDPSKWFEQEVVVDRDFPSGHAVGTQTNSNGCVFLDSTGRCVLQKVEIGERDPNLKLKPFFCKAFPVTIENGTLVYDDYMRDNQPQCCSAVPGGELTIFDIAGWELEFVLGKEGAEELKQMAGRR